MAAFIILSLFFVSSNSLMYDLIVPVATPPAVCSLGCAPWHDVSSAFNTANQSYINALWFNSSVLAVAGTACAMPANFQGQPEAHVGTELSLSFDFSFGPQCYCAGSASAPVSGFGYCGDPAVPTPQQVNLMFGKDETELSVSFVTVDNGRAIISAPIVELCKGAGHCHNASGTSVHASTPQLPARIVTYHVVVLPLITPGVNGYTYRVHPGIFEGVWSRIFTLRARPMSDEPTTIGIAGDLGIYSYNCFTNLLADKTLTSFVHAGDHSYNFAMGGGARGDGYMIGFEPILSNIPWIPVFGNHELEGSPFGAYCPPEEFCQGRYLNQTRALARLGAASGSNSTLYFSIDIGLAHVVVLDYMEYIGLDHEAAAQLQWLAIDLEAAAAPAQRARVPWIIVTGHVPMYSSGSGDSSGLIKDIEPLLFKYAVDLHVVGHDHFYESNWPTGPNGKVGQKNFIKPKAPVHVITGAGGAPAFSGEREFPTEKALPDYVRTLIHRWSWSKAIAYNQSVLRWQQIDNINGTILDEWVIVK